MAIVDAGACRVHQDGPVPEPLTWAPRSFEHGHDSRLLEALVCNGESKLAPKRVIPKGSSASTAVVTTGAQRDLRE
jgi:hypothetical protein